MTLKTKLNVRAAADYYGLKIEYASNLSPKVAGLLVPIESPHTILVNANHSKSDHVFTILHEIGHYILHVERSHRVRLPWYLRRQWQSKRTIRFSRSLRRIQSRIMNPEMQADAWAFCALLQFGAIDDAKAICTRYPEKTWMFLLAVAGSIYNRIKLRIQRVIRRICQPLGA
jgi:hypothetical protein